MAVSMVVSTDGRVDEIDEPVSTVPFDDMAKVTRKILLRQRYGSVELSEELVVRLVLVFRARDQDVGNVDSIPPFREHLDKFREKYPKD